MNNNEKTGRRRGRTFGGLGIALAIFCLACQDKTVEKPTLPEEKMVRVMADLTIADAATMNLPPFQKDSLMRFYFRQVFEMHGTTKEEYEKNLRLYALDVPAMERITTQVEEIFGVDKK